MSRAPPTTALAISPEIPIVSDSSKNSLHPNESIITTHSPKIFSVSTSNYLVNPLGKCEEDLAHEDSHTAPIKLVIASSSCSSSVQVNELIQFSVLNKNASSGDAGAQNQLGQCYINGSGVDINHIKAVSWFRKAAQSNNKEAQQSLAVAYKEGRGVKKDLTLATYWLLKSCSSDDGRNVTISYHRDLIKFIAPVLEKFSEFRDLRKIEFHRLGLIGEGIAAIAQLIQLNPHLEILDLTGNDLGDAEVLLLLQALDNNTHLRQLIFNSTDIDKTILARFDTLVSLKCAKI